MHIILLLKKQNNGAQLFGKVDTILQYFIHTYTCPQVAPLGSHSAKHDVREDGQDLIRESEPEVPIGRTVSRPKAHLVGSLLGDQQHREINKAVNTNCQGDSHKGELICLSP